MLHLFSYIVPKFYYILDEHLGSYSSVEWLDFNNDSEGIFRSFTINIVQPDHNPKFSHLLISVQICCQLQIFHL